MKKLIMIAAVALSTAANAQQPLQDGIKMYHFKKWHSAERILEPLAAADPQANYYLGLSYLYDGNIEKAISVFSKFPEDPANISGTARVAFFQKNVAKGAQIAKELGAKSKKKEWIQEKYAADAITYTEGGDYHQAIAWYTDALTKTDNVELHIALGDAYRKIQGGGGSAMSQYENVTEKDAKNSLGFSRIGDLWYEAHNYPSALDNYAKAKDADNMNPLPYRALAEAYARSGKYKLGLENIKQYYKLSDSTLADKIIYMQISYLAQDYCELAIFAKQVWNTEKLQGDKKTEVLGILGYSQANCGDSVEALKNMRNYFQDVNPKNIKSGDYIEMGKLYMKLGMFDSAGIFYNKGIEGDTSRNKTDVYRTIAEAFKGKKDYCKSAEWYDNLVKANPETQPLDYFWRGYMYYYCGNLAKALKGFEDFEAKYPDQPSAIYWHGRALAAIDSEAANGTAIPYFTKWLDKVGPTYEKKGDMKIAYKYLLLHYFNKSDKENTAVYKEKLKGIDPQDAFLKQIEDAEKPAQAPKKPAPSKPKK